VVLSLAREQMAPPLRPKKMLKFGTKKAGKSPRRTTARKRT
jgi:cell division protein FtsW